MIVLIIYVFNHCSYIVWGYREDPIAILPIKVSIFWINRFDLFGWTLFNLLNQCHLSNLSWMQSQNMNMIFMPPNLYGITIQIFTYTTNIIVKIVFDLVVNQIFSMFCTEYNVSVNFRKWLWHRMLWFIRLSPFQGLCIDLYLWHSAERYVVDFAPLGQLCSRRKINLDLNKYNKIITFNYIRSFFVNTLRLFLNLIHQRLKAGIAKRFIANSS